MRVHTHTHTHTHTQSICPAGPHTPEHTHPAHSQARIHAKQGYISLFLPSYLAFLDLQQVLVGHGSQASLLGLVHLERAQPMRMPFP
jgi:hypothetical protein